MNTDLSSFKKKAKTKVIHAGIITDDSKIFDFCFQQTTNQTFWDSTKTKSYNSKLPRINDQETISLQLLHFSLENTYHRQAVWIHPVYLLPLHTHRHIFAHF